MNSNAPPNAATPKPKCRWFSFSLRTLLIFVTVAGCGLGWLGMKVREAREQATAVAAIQKMGAQVVCDYQRDAQDDEIPNATPSGPAWLRVLLGDDLFRNVVWVNFPHGCDDDLAFVKELTTLKCLDLSYTQVSDAGLEHLWGLTTLKTLRLDNLQVSDAGLANLTGLFRLEELDLCYTHVTDAGLDYLKGLTQLKHLSL